jgi:hypothetical protein
MLGGQSQLVVHTTAVGGKQYPMRQTVPVAQVASLAQRLRHMLSTQSLPPAQSPALRHVPAGLGWHRPSWQLSALGQSLSTEQPLRHWALTHHEP